MPSSSRRSALARHDALFVFDRIDAAIHTRNGRAFDYRRGVIRFDRDDMIKRFIASRTSGFYFSVVEEGEVEAGSPVEIVQRDPDRVSVNDINHLYYGTSHSRELLQRAVSLEALPASWRDYLRERGLAREHRR